MNLVVSPEGAANVAVAVAESVQYQGRKASRHGSEQRRQLILDTAMRIVVRDGVHFGSTASGCGRRGRGATVGNHLLLQGH